MDTANNTISSVMPELVNYQEQHNLSSKLYGVTGTVVDSLVIIQNSNPDCPVQRAFQEVLDEAVTQTEYKNRQSGAATLWAHLESVGLVDKSNLWILTQEKELPSGNRYFKQVFAESYKEAFSLINEQEDLTTRWAAVVYLLANGRNSDLYDSFPTPAGIVLRDRVVKVSSHLLSQINDLDLMGNITSEYKADVNSSLGIQAHKDSNLDKALGTNPRSLRLTGLYLLRKEPLSWEEIKENLDKKINERATEEVDALLST